MTVIPVIASLPVNERYTVSPDHAPDHALDRIATSVRIGLAPNSVKCHTSSRITHPIGPGSHGPSGVTLLIILFPVRAPPLHSLT
ncbi:TPA: hypothetical protein DCZ39_07970 [Patescibacteria group bacterium]|nr:hypothetical protein [Candidatus Gracilibacteria bacterium]